MLSPQLQQFVLENCSRGLLLDENRLSQVLFIDTEYLCGFLTLRGTKTHYYFNNCRENIFMNAQGNFLELLELSYTIHN
jgi:hypothetical protein